MKEKYEKPVVEIEEFSMAEHIAKCEQSTNLFYLGSCQSDKPIYDENLGYEIFTSNNDDCFATPEDEYCYNSTDSSLAAFGS
ncbi:MULTISPECIES: hypothetical protein [unclassified Romboutsia]|uniref:hypothetical protein n=1 Tax=unclassified Romboutsia TaxID=2626894 RepID=UPI0008221074|nr:MULTISPECIES: hypothetical protein [unclassified Romboutsia]SCH19545.1 Uncharacterised protein [uncultured Clostridium sp.]